MTRIIVADHNLQTRTALKLLLEEQPDVEVVGATDDGESLFELAANAPSDVILMERNLPGVSLRDLVTRLHELESRPFVIVMGSHSEYGRSALNAGADAFISKSDEPAWLLDRIQSFSSQSRT